MQTFYARQSLKLRVPSAPIPIEDYLQEPKWLVAAITEADQVEAIGDDCFRLELRAKRFMQLQFKPQVDLKIWMGTDGTLYIRSTNCQIIGLEDLQRSFSLELAGELAPLHKGPKTWLHGSAQIEVNLELPAPLKMIPGTVMKSAGNSFLGGILKTMKGRVRRQLVKDYRRWAQVQATDTATAVANS
ncbi:hypothetical protein C7271_01115 [filamentous cyanobacterium CCP5]|nr:hypothetical protein C7271_01115 [filamentous cyanobacterium CCP5]